MWVRLGARGLAASHSIAVRALLERVDLLEMAPAVLERALQPFPSPVRTLDALHLASCEFLRLHGQSVAVASYDLRFKDCARALGLALYPGTESQS